MKKVYTYNAFHFSCYDWRTPCCHTIPYDQPSKLNPYTKRERERRELIYFFFYEQKQTFAGLRQYSTGQEPKKTGSKLLVAALIGAGIAGGITYNSAQTKIVPQAVKQVITEKSPSAFSNEAFVTLKVNK